MHDTVATPERPASPNTVAVRKAIEGIEEDLQGAVDGWFGEIEDRMTEMQEIIRSAALRKAISELTKLRKQVTTDLFDRLLDVDRAYEMHDAEVEGAIEAAGEVEDAA